MDNLSNSETCPFKKITLIIFGRKKSSKNVLMLNISVTFNSLPMENWAFVASKCAKQQLFLLAQIEKLQLKYSDKKNVFNSMDNGVQSTVC